MKKVHIWVLGCCLGLFAAGLSARCLKDKHIKVRNKKKTYICTIKKKNKKRFKAGKCKFCGCAAKHHDNE